MGDVGSVYDNSKEFKKYLARHNLDSVLRRSKLRQRSQHIIVPHVSNVLSAPYFVLNILWQRLCIPITAPASATPEFDDKDSWYLQVCLFCHGDDNLWSHRFAALSSLLLAALPGMSVTLKYHARSSHSKGSRFLLDAPVPVRFEGTLFVAFHRPGRPRRLEPRHVLYIIDCVGALQNTVNRVITVFCKSGCSVLRTVFNHIAISSCRV